MTLLLWIIFGRESCYILIVFLINFLLLLSWVDFVKLVFLCYHYFIIYQKMLGYLCCSFSEISLFLILLPFLTAAVYEICLFSVVWSLQVDSLSLNEYCWVCLGLYFRWLNLLRLHCMWLEFIVFCTSWNVLFSRMVFKLNHEGN